MKVFSLLIILFVGYLTGLQAQNPDLPVELKPFIQKGYEAMDFAKQDLNGDKLPDYILILKLQGEDTMTFDNPDWEAGRPFLLILRQSNGSLKQTVSNNDLFYVTVVKSYVYATPPFKKSITDSTIFTVNLK